MSGLVHTRKPSVFLSLKWWRMYPTKLNYLWRAMDYFWILSVFAFPQAGTSWYVYIKLFLNSTPKRQTYPRVSTCIVLPGLPFPIVLMEKDNIPIRRKLRDAHIITSFWRGFGNEQWMPRSHLLIIEHVARRRER